MKKQFFCIMMILIITMPLTAAVHSNNIPQVDQQYTSSKINQQNDQEPLPFYRYALVFFVGEAEVMDYNSSMTPDITIRPKKNIVRWFCLGKPWYAQTNGLAVSLHDYRGYVGPEPIDEQSTILLIVAYAKDVVTMFL